MIEYALTAGSYIGNPMLYLLLSAFIYWCINKKTGFRILIVVLFSVYLSNFMKYIFKVPRPTPQSEEPNLLQSEYSFPSTHALSTASFWTYVSMITKRKILFGTGCIVILIVSYSRIALGAHHLTDVIAGIVAGIVLSVTFYFVMKKLRSRASFRQKVFFSIIGCIFLCALSFNQTSLILCSVLAGALIGYWLETKYLNISCSQNISEHMIRIFAGTLILILFYAAAERVSSIPAIFFFFLLGIGVTFIAPLFFFLLER